jgi:hypothetical protein
VRAGGTGVACALRSLTSGLPGRWRVGDTGCVHGIRIGSRPIVECRLSDAALPDVDLRTPAVPECVTCVTAVTAVTDTDPAVSLRCIESLARDHDLHQDGVIDEAALAQVRLDLQELDRSDNPPLG